MNKIRWKIITFICYNYSKILQSFKLSNYVTYHFKSIGSTMYLMSFYVHTTYRFSYCLFSYLLCFSLNIFKINCLMLSSVYFVLFCMFHWIKYLAAILVWLETRLWIDEWSFLSFHLIIKWTKHNRNDAHRPSLRRSDALCQIL